MIHVFLLTILVSGNIVSNDMYFLDINRCNFFAERVAASKRRNTGYKPPTVFIEAYCVPRLVPERNNLKVY